MDWIIALATSVIAAAAGLLGVAVGGWIAAHSQRKARAHDFFRLQLDKFYSPMLGIRALILAKSQVRTEVSGAADMAWRRLTSSASGDVGALRKLEEERFPDFEKIISENNRQLIEKLLPSYQKMVDIFSSNMWLAEPSTLQHFGALVEFVEIWNRWTSGSLPPEVVQEIGHSEEKLKPLYADLSAQMQSLRNKLASE